MNFKKFLIFVFIGICPLFSIYSFGPFFKSNTKTDSNHEPVFVYKDLLGLKRSMFYSHVERLLDYRVQIVHGISVNVFWFIVAKKFNLPSVAQVLIVLGANGLLLCEARNFQNQAGPWLQALKEKQLENAPYASKNF